jgi:hypothetical protein
MTLLKSHPRHYILAKRNTTPLQSTAKDGLLFRAIWRSHPVPMMDQYAHLMEELAGAKMSGGVLSAPITER